MKTTRETILRFDAVFEEQEGGGYTVTVPSLSGCISEGDTFEDAKANIAEAITVYIESLEMDGEEIPQGDLPVFIEKIEVHKPVLTA